MPAVWEVLDVGEFLWWKEQVCEVMEQSCGGMLAVVYVFGGGTGAEVTPHCDCALDFRS